MSEDKNEQLNNLRHSCAHLLAAAVLELYPGTKHTIGPAIENGFYFDFEFQSPITEEDLPKIEAKMAELLPTWKEFKREEISAGEAKERYQDNEYKLELINEFADQGQTLSIYHSGEYFDLCRGGHSEKPDHEIKAFKLLSIAGAYWRGNEKNKMLTRIYGTAFPTQEELDQHLQYLEELKKRDHRKLGKELDLYVSSELVGGGLPLFTPKGTVLRDELAGFSEKLQKSKGFQKVWIPHIAKTDLYKKSGHWDKFGDELFLVKSQETKDEFVMKPMNCPHHAQIYASQTRSYRDLPIRYFETTTVYRDEKAGELFGLARVRSATQDDAHVFCTLDQIEQEFTNIMDMIKDMYSALGLQFKARLSFRDPNDPKKYLGENEQWEKAQKILEDVAKKLELDYSIAEGEAAFYGPKIDIMVTDSLGRERQLATEQLDFVQPARFGLTYIDVDGSQKTPVMIHKALLGSVERFLSVYIEHTAGEFPLWLSPVQVKIVPITDENIEYAQKVLSQLNSEGIRAEIDTRAEKMQGKIRDAAMQKIPYIFIIGKREAEAGAVAVRTQHGQDLGAKPVESVINELLEEINSKANRV